jgi:hypothetical protein
MTRSVVGSMMTSYGICFRIFTAGTGGVARNLLMFPTRYDGFKIPPSKCHLPGCPIGRQHGVEMEFDMVREVEKG